MPPDHGVLAVGAVAPCGGLAPGRYILRMGSASRALLGDVEVERPSFYASEALEYRRANGAADQLDRHYLRVVGLIITEQWEDAARAADAALQAYPNAWVLHYYRGGLPKRRATTPARSSTCAARWPSSKSAATSSG